jgi:putative DNA primase/helicase
VKGAIQSHFGNDYTPFYEKYLPKIEKIGGDEFKAICPFHDDTNPSLNIDAKTGRYYCHGCGKKGDIFHFYGKINGLHTGSDFRKILRGICSDLGINAPEQQKGRITQTYDYTDADGKLLFQVCRFEPGKNGKPKDFRQRRPDTSGEWIYNLKGVEPVLYRLPEVAQAEEVLIVEGEKDSNNLAALGFTATTVPGGAGKWRPEYSDAIKGKHIVLIPDNDVPGREHMAKIGAAINGNSKSLKLLTLPGLPSKGDVSDFIALFPDKEEAKEKLAVLIDGCEPYSPPKNYTIEDAVLKIEEFTELHHSQRTVYLDPWVKENAIGLISGWRGTGKTMLAMSVVQSNHKREIVRTVGLPTDRRLFVFGRRDALFGHSRAHQNAGPGYSTAGSFLYVLRRSCEYLRATPSEPQFRHVAADHEKNTDHQGHKIVGHRQLGIGRRWPG